MGRDSTEAPEDFKDDVLFDGFKLDLPVPPLVPAKTPLKLLPNASKEPLAAPEFAVAAALGAREEELDRVFGFCRVILLETRLKASTASLPTTTVVLLILLGNSKTRGIPTADDWKTCCKTGSSLLPCGLFLQVATFRNLNWP